MRRIERGTPTRVAFHSARAAALEDEAFELQRQLARRAAPAR
jgi:hypothetical protein